jgi:hypothetical protein
MRFHLRASDHGVMDPAPARDTIRINGHLGTTMLSGLDLVEVHQDPREA